MSPTAVKVDDAVVPSDCVTPAVVSFSAPPASLIGALVAFSILFAVVSTTLPAESGVNRVLENKLPLDAPMEKSPRSTPSPVTEMGRVEAKLNAEGRFAETL